MIGIKTIVTMERTLYLDLPDGTSKEDVLKAAEKEVILPINAMSMASTTLRNLHVNVPHLDLGDWSTSNVKQEIVK